MRAMALPLALAGGGGVALVWAEGLGFWPALGLAGVGLSLLAVRAAGGRPPGLPLAVGAVCFALWLAEAALWGLERDVDRPLPPPGSEAGARYRAFEAAAPAGEPRLRLPPEVREKIALMQRARVLPQAWNRQVLDPVPGRKTPYRWHGAVHVFDARKMRRSGPFPLRDARPRILAVGDSFTYGEAVDAFWTWPAQLERRLSERRPTEVLNLGVRGDASEDVLGVVRELVPPLDPDLVIYGVCLNDFLPSRTLEGTPWPFPLPKAWKEFLRDRTRVGQLVHERYGALLRRLGLRPGFYSRLLEDFEANRARFARDVRDMNAFVTGRGLPPVIGTVLDAGPVAGGPGQELARAAEDAMRDAGMIVAGSADDYRRYDGRNLGVSRFDPHPNEEAHAIFASRLAAVLAERGLPPERAPGG